MVVQRSFAKQFFIHGRPQPSLLLQCLPNPITIGAARRARQIALRKNCVAPPGTGTTAAFEKYRANRADPRRWPRRVRLGAIGGGANVTSGGDGTGQHGLAGVFRSAKRRDPSRRGGHLGRQKSLMSRELRRLPRIFGMHMRGQAARLSVRTRPVRSAALSQPERGLCCSPLASRDCTRRALCEVGGRLRRP